MFFPPCPVEVYEVPEEEVRLSYSLTHVALTQGTITKVIVEKKYIYCQPFRGEKGHQIFLHLGL